MKVAFLFPGQGAQKVGMGKDLYEKYDEVKKVFEIASNVSGIDIPTLCFNGIRKAYDGKPYFDSGDVGDDLNKTENTQIAIATMSMGIVEVLKKNNVNAEVSAGLSLGEYSALMYSNVIDFESGLKLLVKRGFLMQHRVPEANYSMLAVIGTDAACIENVCDEVRNKGLFVVPANYNYSGQTVISGYEDAVLEAESLLKEHGAKKLVKLKTSGPFHTSLLSDAKNEFEKELENVDFNVNECKVVKNIDGMLYSNDDDFKMILSNHIVSPVRFDKTICSLNDMGVDTFVEVGPGKALTGFVKKELADAKVLNVFDVDSLNEVIDYFKEGV